MPLPSCLRRWPVRSRIAALALALLISLLVGALNHLATDSEPKAAPGDAQASAALAAGSRDFRAAIETLRLTAREFAARPQSEPPRHFAVAVDAALTAIDNLGTADDAGELGQARTAVLGLKLLFDELVRCQQQLGFDPGQGLMGRVQSISDAAESMIGAHVAHLHEADAAWLMASLQAMGRHELHYLVTRDETEIRIKFFSELGTFHEILDRSDMTADLRAALRSTMAAYADAFRAMISLMDRVHTLERAIDGNARRLERSVEAIIKNFRERAQHNGVALARGHAHNVTLITLAVALLMAGALALSRPIRSRADTPTARVATMAPAAAPRDAAVLAFRREAGVRLAPAPPPGDGVGKVRVALARLEAAASALNGAADAVSAAARLAEQRLGDTADNAEAAASSRASAPASEAATRAAAELARTADLMSDLSGAASKIDDVVGLIQAITGRTYLIACRAAADRAGGELGDHPGREGAQPVVLAAAARPVIMARRGAVL
jgi:methyl-accepting chemotaxis protein